MKKKIYGIVLTFLLLIASATAQAENLPSNGPATISTETIVKDLFGIQDSAARVLLQYLVPVEYRTADNPFLLPVQIKIDNGNNDLRVTIQYQVII